MLGERESQGAPNGLHAKGNYMAAGRPTKYDDIDLKLVERLCKLGLTDKQLAEALNISEATLNNWKLEHPKFLESIKEGKVIADANVAAKLYDRACGYSHKEDKIFQYEGQPLIVPTIKHYPPDTAAAFIWLKNRQPEIWRDKQEIEHSGEKNIVVFSDKVQDKLKNAGDDL